VAAARILLVNLLLSSVVVGAAALILQADALWPFVLPLALAPLFWPLLILGTAPIAWAVAVFVREGGASGAVGHRPRLVTGGPFRYLRNPIYAGVCFLLLAVALVRRSPSFLLAAILFAPIIDVYVRQVEEPRLTARFGEAYRRYAEAVPRWIPRLTAQPDVRPAAPDHEVDDVSIDHKHHRPSAGAGRTIRRGVATDRRGRCRLERSWPDRPVPRRWRRRISRGRRVVGRAQGL